MGAGVRQLLNCSPGRRCWTCWLPISDMAQELFGGCIDSEMSLSRAIVRGVCDYKRDLNLYARYRTEDGVVFGLFLANLRQAKDKGSRSSFLTPERIAQ